MAWDGQSIVLGAGCVGFVQLACSPQRLQLLGDLVGPRESVVELDVGQASFLQCFLL